MLPDVKRTLDFWFEGDDKAPQMKWFQPPENFDDRCRDELGPLVDRARSGEFDQDWTTEPESTLALVILLDQMPRNVFRNSADAFSSDGKASQIAIQALARDFDQRLPPLKAAFLYLPLEHDERLVSQVAAVALFEKLVGRCESGSAAGGFAQTALEAARQHRDVILRLGRFPARNKVLGRQSTAEEDGFLRDHPAGF